MYNRGSQRGGPHGDGRGGSRGQIIIYWEITDYPGEYEISAVAEAEEAAVSVGLEDEEGIVVVLESLDVRDEDEDEGLVVVAGAEQEAAQKS